MVYVPIQMPLFNAPISSAYSNPIQMPLSNASIQMPRFKCLYSNASLRNASIQTPRFKCLDSNASLLNASIKCLYSNALESLHSPLSPCTPPLSPRVGSGISLVLFRLSQTGVRTRDALRLALYCHHLRPSVYYCSGFTPGTWAHRPPVLDQSNPSVKSISHTHQSNPSVFCRD
jgi:hypothetical protein